MRWYQKGKTNLDFTEARDNEWQWHQLGHMQVCTLLQTDNYASTPPLSFLHAGWPFCRQTKLSVFKNRLKTYLFRRCYETVWLSVTFPFPSHYLPPQNSGPCNSFYCLGHFKNVYDDDDDDDDETNSIKALKAGEYWLVFECILLTHVWQESRAKC